MQGDTVSLHFPIADLAPLADGMERDYFLYVAAWFKDEPSNWGYGFPFTVDPLPFRNMSGFPYLSTESYPYDSQHLNYIQQYNTRAIIPTNILPAQESAIVPWVLATAILIAVVNLGLLLYFKKRITKFSDNPADITNPETRGQRT
jgi:hypothetical protein